MESPICLQSWQPTLLSPKLWCWFAEITLLCIQIKTLHGYQEKQLPAEGFWKAKGDKVSRTPEVLEGCGYLPNLTWLSPSTQSPSSIFSATSQAPKLWWELIFFFSNWSIIALGFPGGASGKNLPANAEDIRDGGSIPGLGRSPRGGRAWQLTLVFLPGNPMDKEACQATVHRVTKNQTRLQQLSAHTHTPLLYNGVWVYAVQQCESATGMYISPRSWTSLLHLHPTP